MICARNLRISAFTSRIVAGASRIVAGTSVFERLCKLLEDL